MCHYRLNQLRIFLLQLNIICLLLLLLWLLLMSCLFELFLMLFNIVINIFIFRIFKNNFILINHYRSFFDFLWFIHTWLISIRFRHFPHLFRLYLIIYLWTCQIKALRRLLLLPTDLFGLFNNLTCNRFILYGFFNSFLRNVFNNFLLHFRRNVINLIFNFIVISDLSFSWYVFYLLNWNIIHYCLGITF